MDDFEVLAALKEIYEISLDLKENSELFSNRTDIFLELQEKYMETYNKITKENGGPLSILHQNNVYIISSNVEGDYLTKNGKVLTCGDLDFYWYRHPNECKLVIGKDKLREDRLR